jgi:hypothetical protein
MHTSGLGNQIGEIVQESLVMGGVGCVAAWSLTYLNPALGLAYGATYTLSGYLLNAISGSSYHHRSENLIGIAVKTGLAALVTLKIFGLAFTAPTVFALGGSFLVGRTIYVLLNNMMNSRDLSSIARF